MQKPNEYASYLCRKKPTMCDYNPLESYIQTQKPPINFVFKNEKRIAFTDTFAKAKKKVPSASQYKVEPLAYKMLSKAPQALRKHRQ